MKFVKFPNGNVWRLANEQIRGMLMFPGCEARNLVLHTDDLAKEATGKGLGLIDIEAESRGKDVVAFKGTLFEAAWPEGTEATVCPQVLEASDPEVREALKSQYGLMDIEVDHALANLDTAYGSECVLDIFGTPRRIHTPAHPQECSYVRVTVDGLEVAYWVEDEWQADPAGVMGAFIGAAKGG